MNTDKDVIKKLRSDEIARLSKLTNLTTYPGDVDRGVLLSDQILEYYERCKLIEPFDPDCLRPAGYDLRVGHNCSIHGERKILDEGIDLEIAPYQVAIIETDETLNLPRFIIGRWNIRVTLAYSGLLWVGGAQVDPGFRGRLCCPIYNLSTETVKLSFKQKLAMIDFVTTTQFRTGCKIFPWDERRMLVFQEYGSLNSGIEEEVQKFQNRVASHELQTEEKLNKAKEAVGTKFSDIQTRMDNFVLLIFTVLGILFAGVGVVVTKSSESALVVPSFSLVTIAAIALYFALRSQWLLWKAQKRIEVPSDGHGPINAREFIRASVGWGHVVIVSLLIALSLLSDSWSLYKFERANRASEIAQGQTSRTLEQLEQQKSTIEKEMQELKQQNALATGEMEKRIHFLEQTKRDK